MMILGIDPAKDGAAVLLNERGEVTDVWSWRYMKRKQSVYKTLHTYIDSQATKSSTDKQSSGMEEP